MTQTYARKMRPGASPERAETQAAGPSIQALASGAAPTAEQMGSRVDLPGEIREKMESSFGADFSNVRLYESETVADAGAEAVTQGNNIAFAPGKLDLASTAGQALLGHELSHVVSQARGESAGQGFLNDAHLEAQADAQGMMAAQGQSVYAGPVSPMGASSTTGAAGPMQAKKIGKGNRDRGGIQVWTPPSDSSTELAPRGPSKFNFFARGRRILNERFGNRGGGGNAAPQTQDEELEPGELIPTSQVPTTTFAGRPLTEVERLMIQHVQGFPRDFWDRPTDN